MTTAVTILTGLIIIPGTYSSAQTVEVTLLHKLDDARGFCLDIRGPKERANPKDGLQAHTCYSYQGQLAVDQTFDSELIASGVFRITGFDVCMTLDTAEPGSPLTLLPCSGSAQQHFEFTEDGSIRPRTSTELCVTVADGESRRGRGGTSSHLIRDLTLQPCSADLVRHQRWRLREKAD